MSLNYNEVMVLMKDFGIDFLNRYNELIIDEPSNTYVNISDCEDIEDVKTYVVFALCRPIYKGLGEKASNRLLNRVNKYFETSLTKEDMGLMYQALCYKSKVNEFKEFIQKGFPMAELKTKCD